MIKIFLRYGLVLVVACALAFASQDGMEASHTLQDRLMQAAQKVKADLNASEVFIGVMRADTGEVIALTKSGSTLADFTDYAYEPGGAMAPFVVAAYLEAEDNATKAAEANVTVPKGVMRVSKNGHVELHDALSSKMLRVDELLVAGSKKGIATLALKTDAKALYDALRRYGFGRQSGFGGTHDANGTLRKPSYLKHPIARAALANGYGISATPMQMLRAYAMFANGGMSVTPHRGNGKAEAKCAMKKKIAELVNDMLVESWQCYDISKTFQGVRIGIQTAMAHRAAHGRYLKAYNQTVYGFVVTPQGKPYVIGVAVLNPKRIVPTHQSVVPLFSQTVRYLME